jgi:hypothetical protein
MMLSEMQEIQAEFQSMAEDLTNALQLSVCGCGQPICWRDGRIVFETPDSPIGHTITRCQHCGDERALYIKIATQAPGYNVKLVDW